MNKKSRFFEAFFLELMFKMRFVVLSVCYIKKAVSTKKIISILFEIKEDHKSTDSLLKPIAIEKDKVRSNSMIY